MAVNTYDRLYIKLGVDDLREMKDYGLNELDRFLHEIASGKYRAYESRLIAICLCQGAAQHFVDGKKGYRYLAVL